MANTFVPDQSEEFRKSGMRLITDPSSDDLLNKAQAQEKQNAGDATDVHAGTDGDAA